MVSSEFIVATSGVIGGLIVGLFTIRQTLITNKNDSDKKYAKMVTDEGTSVKNFISNKLEVIDTKFQSIDKQVDKAGTDVKDVEAEMKKMVKQFGLMCEKLAKHDYVIEDVLPEYTALYKEFVNFKAAVDVKLKSNSDLVNSNEDESDKGSDQGNVENITRSVSNRDEINR